MACEVGPSSSGGVPLWWSGGQLGKGSRLCGVSYGVCSEEQMQTQFLFMRSSGPDPFCGPQMWDVSHVPGKPSALQQILVSCPQSQLSAEAVHLEVASDPRAECSDPETVPFGCHSQAPDGFACAALTTGMSVGAPITFSLDSVNLLRQPKELREILSLVDYERFLLPFCYQFI